MSYYGYRSTKNSDSIGSFSKVLCNDTNSTIINKTTVDGRIVDAHIRCDFANLKKGEQHFYGAQYRWAIRTTQIDFCGQVTPFYLLFGDIVGQSSMI